MTDTQTAVLSAYLKMLIECDNAPRSVAKIQLFSNKIARIREIVAEIQTLSPQYSESTKGLTSEKNTHLDELIDLTVDVAGAVHSYANEKGDKDLEEKVNYNRSAIMRLSQDRILLIAEVVLNNANKVPAAELAEAGISAEELTEFAALISKLKTMVPGKAVADVEKTAIGQRIRDLFAELSDIKANHLNRLSKQYIRKDPDFYYRYKSTMVVRYPSSKKTDTTTKDTNAAS